MAFKYSTGFRNAVLDTSSVRAVFSEGTIKYYAGTVPDTADAALGGATELVEFTVDAGATGLTLAATASQGTLTKTVAEAWQGVAGATGTVTFFRFEKAGDLGDLSGTAQRIQGTVGGPGADLFVPDTAIVAASTYNIDYFALTFSGDLVEIPVP